MASLPIRSLPHAQQLARPAIHPAAGHGNGGPAATAGRQALAEAVAGTADRARGGGDDHAGRERAVPRIQRAHLRVDGAVRAEVEGAEGRLVDTVVFDLRYGLSSADRVLDVRDDIGLRVRVS